MAKKIKSKTQPEPGSERMLNPQPEPPEPFAKGASQFWSPTMKMFVIGGVVAAVVILSIVIYFLTLPAFPTGG